jgi:hypothetical protein
VKGVAAEEDASRKRGLWVQPEQVCNCHHACDGALSGTRELFGLLFANAFYYIAKPSGWQAGFFIFTART